MRLMMSKSPKKDWPEGCNAHRIPTEVEEVVLETVAGTKRVVPQPISDPIPRVC